MLDKRLIQEIIKSRFYFLAMGIYGCFSLLFSFCTAFLLSNIVATVFMKQVINKNTIMEFVILGLLIPIKAGITFVLQKYFREFANEQKNKILLNAVERFLKKGPIDTKSQPAGGFVASWLEAADNLEPFYGEYLPQFVVMIIMVPMIIVIGFFYDWISALIMLFTGPLLPFFLALIGIQSKEANGKRLNSLAELGNRMLDFLNGVRTLKIFNGEKNYRQVISRTSEEFRIQTMEVLKIAFLSAFVLEFAATISTAVIAVSLGLRLLYGKMEFQPAFFILLITPDYYMTLRKFGSKFHTAMGAKAAADKLYEKQNQMQPRPAEFHDDVPEDNPQQLTLSESVGSKLNVVLQDVNFQYPDTMVKALQQVNMTIEHNKITALVGKSGAGKSTLIYLIMKFMQSQGSIYFNHVEISNLKKEDIRALIGYIPQKPHVFHDTLRNNLLHSKETASDLELYDALAKARLLEFLNKLPQGLETVLTEVGGNISAGEAQRLAYARVFLKNSPFIILDESTSALDLENETKLQESFADLTKNKTVLIIAHRLYTVEKADLIYVLKEGKVAEFGNHNQLLQKQGVYQELAQTWEKAQ